MLLITSKTGVDSSQSFWGSAWRNQGVLHYGLYILYFYLGSFWNVTSSRHLASWAIVSSTLFASLHVAYQAILKFAFNSSSITTYNSRLVGSFENPNLLALQLIVSIPFCIFLIKTVKNTNVLLILRAVLVIIIVSSVFTFSKTALLLLGLLFLYEVLPGLIERKNFLMLFTVPVLLVSISITALRYLPYVKNYQHESRIEIWENGLVAFSKKPLAGYGWGNAAYAMKGVVTLKSASIYNLHVDRAHNELIELLVTTGIPGLLLFLVIINQAFKKIVNKWKTSKAEIKHWHRTLAICLALILVFLQGNFVLTDGYLSLWFLIAAIHYS